MQLCSQTVLQSRELSTEFVRGAQGYKVLGSSKIDSKVSWSFYTIEGIIMLQASHTYIRINSNATVNRFHGIALCVLTSALIPR